MRRLLYSAYQRTFRRTSECSIKAKTFLQNGRTSECAPQFCIQELRTGKRRVKKLPTIFTIILGNDTRDAEEKLTAHRIKKRRTLPRFLQWCPPENALKKRAHSRSTSRGRLRRAFQKCASYQQDYLQSRRYRKFQFSAARQSDLVHRGQYPAQVLPNAQYRKS